MLNAFMENATRPGLDIGKSAAAYRGLVIDEGLAAADAGRKGGGIWMLRPLRQEDAEFLCSIFKDNPEYYRIFFDAETRLSAWEKRVKRFVEQESIRHFIIEIDKMAVGWISWEDVEAEVRELGIVVIKKEYLRCGYGTAALGQFIEKCKTDNIYTILLSVNQDNERAIQFYKKQYILFF